jgi:hypothetical protein
MKLRIAVGLMVAFAPLASVAAMPVSTFLEKADGLKGKGPFALFSGDFKLLMGQIKADAAELKANNHAAVEAGRPKAYCTPAGGVRLTNKDILEAMQAVPPPQRATTHTKDALRAYFARRFPCPA